MECTSCNSSMVFRTGRFGNFWGCSNYPKCHNKLSIKGSGKVFVKKECMQPEHVNLIQGSEQQELLWEFMLHGKGHCVVHACPGTGKTFSLVQGTARLDREKHSVLYLAFNNTIKDEMLTKAPKGVEVRGINQFGYQIITKAFKNTKVDDNKYFKLYNKFFPAISREELKCQTSSAFKVKELVNLCQAYFTDGNDEEKLAEIISKHDIRLPSPQEDKIVKAISKLLVIGKENVKTITFGDQLWLPVVLDLPTPQYDYVCVDEAQDLNAIQHLLIIRTLHSNSRAIIVGDENQAIYSFRGADSNSMDSMTEYLNDTGKDVQHFPLTKTWRCGKNIVQFAKQYVPQIEAHESNPDGKVIDSFDLDFALNDIAVGDMVLCRMNAPLLSLGYKLMRKNKRVCFVGKPFGEAILGLAETFNATDIVDLQVKLNAYEDKETQKLLDKKNQGSKIGRKLEDLSDKVDCIRTYLSMQKENVAVEIFYAEMRKFFCSETMDPDAITLTSIHKAKGTERDRVFYFMPDISFANMTEGEMKEEENLKFVAITRAKNYLCMVHCTKEQLKEHSQDELEIMA